MQPSLIKYRSLMQSSAFWKILFTRQSQDRKDPKAVIKISDINVAFSPTKIPFPNSLQIDYLKVNNVWNWSDPILNCKISTSCLFKDGSTRHIYVYHDDPQTVVNWYHAIRCCKLHLLQVPLRMVDYYVFHDSGGVSIRVWIRTPWAFKPRLYLGGE